tara:strand:- start:572 stop:910 length:339 start_codon:yes stop_codon:yes gene_type:complete
MKAQAINDALAPIRDRFYQSLRATQHDVHVELERALNDSATGRDALRQIATKLHKIAGSAGTLGFTRLGEQAHTTEYVIIDVLKSQSRSPTEAYLQVIEFLESCSDVLDADQ